MSGSRRFRPSRAGSYQPSRTTGGRSLRDALNINREQSHIPTVEHWFDTFERNQPCPCGSGRKFKRCHGTSRWRTLELVLEHPHLGVAPGG
ncbi:MAG: SEC-C metal-binding domain-containing protein [Acidimicrobiales bacterium]